MARHTYAASRLPAGRPGARASRAARSTVPPFVWEACLCWFVRAVHHTSLKFLQVIKQRTSHGCAQSVPPTPVTMTTVRPLSPFWSCRRPPSSARSTAHSGHPLRDKYGVPSIVVPYCRQAESDWAFPAGASRVPPIALHFWYVTDGWTKSFAKYPPKGFFAVATKCHSHGT